MMECGTQVNINDVISSLLNLISSQALQIAKLEALLEALNKKLIEGAEEQEKKE